MEKMLFWEQIEQMEKLIDKGASIEEIQMKVKPDDFFKSYWMMIYQTAHDPFEKREARNELRKRMLIN